MFKEKLMSIIKKDGEITNKRKIENLVAFIILIIVIILVINMVWNDNSKKSVSDTTYVKLAESKDTVNSNNKLSAEYNLEQDLEDILSKISGAGKVKVLLTYSESSQIIPMSNQKYKETQTDEGDKTGGTRKIQESDNTTEIIYKENNGQKEIITQKIIMPKIEGALILSKRCKQCKYKNKYYTSSRSFNRTCKP